MGKSMILSQVPCGKVFKIGEHEYIKFSDENGVTEAVSREILFDSTFGDDNNMQKSRILEKLKAEILPAAEEVAGAENVLEFDTDLLSLDGSARHGILRSKVSLPTFDFYRKNRAVFEKYKPDEWWWLATPDSTSEYNNDNWNVCVSPSGNFGRCNIISLGVRPFWNFVSSISVSYEG